MRRRCPATALRFEGAVSRYVQYTRLGPNFDVVEAPDWFAEGLIFLCSAFGITSSSSPSQTR